MFWLIILLNLGLLAGSTNPFAVKPGTRPLYFGNLGTVTHATHRAMSAANLAAWIINNASEILPGYTLVPVIGDDIGVASNNFFLMLDFASGTSTPPVEFVIGPIQSSAATIAGEVATPYKLPLISAQASAGGLTGTNDPYFSRLIYSDSFQGVALANLIVEMGWNNVGVLWSTDDYGTSLVNIFQSACGDLGINIGISQSFDVSATDVNAQAAQMKRSGLVIFVIIGLSAQLTAFIAPSLQAQGMSGAPYVYLFPDGITMNNPGPYQEFTAGCLQTTPAWPTNTPEYLAFAANWNAIAHMDKTILMNTTSTTNLAVTAASYDSVFLVAMAYAALLELNATCLANISADPLCELDKGDQLNALIRNTTLQGASGYIALDANGERLNPSYGIINGLTNGSTVQVGWISNGEVSFYKQVIWPDGTVAVPLDYIPLPQVELSAKQRATFLAIESLILVVIVLAKAIVWKYRNSTYLRAYSPFFILVLFFGCALFVAGGMVMSFPPKGALCGLSVWFLTLASTCVVAPVGLKLYRLDRIFNAKRMKNVDLPDSALFAALGVVLLVDVFLLLFYSFFTIRVSTTGGCGTGNWGPLACLITIKVLWLMVSFLLLGRTRNIPSNFNEPFTVALVLYTVAACSLLFGLFNGFVSNQDISLMMQIASVLVGALFITVGVVFSKLRTQLTGQHSSHSSGARSTRSPTASNSHEIKDRKRLDRRDLDTVIAHGQMMVGTLTERREKMEAEIVMWTEQVYLAKREVQFLLSSASTTVSASHAAGFSAEAIELITNHTTSRKPTKNNPERSKGESADLPSGTSPGSPGRQLAPVSGVGSSQSHPPMSLRSKASFSQPATATALSDTSSNHDSNHHTLRVNVANALDGPSDES